MDHRLGNTGLDDDISAIYVIHDAEGNELFTFFIKLMVCGQKRHFGTFFNIFDQECLLKFTSSMPHIFSI